MLEKVFGSNWLCNADIRICFEHLAEGVKIFCLRLLGDKNKLLNDVYNNICYLTVKDEQECREICTLDSLCYYSYYYHSEKTSNCFTQLFYNQSEPRCLPYVASNLVRQNKGRFINTKL